MTGAVTELPKPPRDFRGLRDLILELKDTLPKRLAQVAAFAMESPDDIAFGTAASIAEQAAVQPSTLIRFAQALGYRGFSDLQSVFRDRLRDRPASYEDRLAALQAHAGTAPNSLALLAGFADAAIRSIAALHDRIDAKSLASAVDALVEADTIYLMAQRRAYPVTASISYALSALGVKNVLIGSPAGTDPETVSFATDNDAAIAISFTPYAPATLQYARQIAKCGARVVAITDSPSSPLLQSAHCWIEVVEADFEGFRSLAATMSLSMSLAVSVAQARRVGTDP